MLQSLFRIRLRLTCGSKFLEAWTDAIKVVAKLDSIRKKQAEKEGIAVASRKNKRARSDELIESLAEIKEEQRLQRELLQNVLLRLSAQPSVVPSPVVRSPSSLTIETAFHQLLDAYEQTDPDERPRKMRKIMKNVSSDQKQAAEELTQALALSKYIKTEGAAQHVRQSGVHKFVTADPPLLEENLEENLDMDPVPDTVADLEHWNEVLRDFLVQDP